MEIKFQTKEESKKAQLESFLKLSKMERIYHFINIIQKTKQLPIKSESESESKLNFLIVLKSV